MALKEIKRGYGVGEALEEQVAQAEEMIERYGWQNMTIAPYGHAEPLMKVIGWVGAPGIHKSTLCPARNSRLTALLSAKRPPEQASLPQTQRYLGSATAS